MVYECVLEVFEQNKFPTHTYQSLSRKINKLLLNHKCYLTPLIIQNDNDVYPILHGKHIILISISFSYSPINNLKFTSFFFHYIYTCFVNFLRVFITQFEKV